MAPTAEELLLGAVRSNLGEPVSEDKIIHVNMDTRTILIPKNIYQLGVESDDDVKKLTFRVPKQYYDCDLSEFNIYINYMNAKKEGDLFEVFRDQVRIVGDNLEFDWLVGRHAVAYKGNVIFNICMKLLATDEGGQPQVDGEGNVIVDKEFNTTIATLPVLQGLETGEEIAEQYVDILMQWENALFNGTEAVGTEQQRLVTLKGSEMVNAVEAEGTEQLRQITLKGSEMVTAVENEGTEQQRQLVLKGSEITNTLDQTVPTSVANYIAAHPGEFVGPAGPQGDPFEYSDFTPEQLEALTGPQGPKGDQGDSITILGSYNSEAELRAAHPTGEVNQAYLVNGYLYVWSATENDWVNVGLIQGPKGDPFEYSDFTPEQLEALRGPQGNGLDIEDVYPTLAALRQAYPTGNNKAYQVTGSNNEIFIWSETSNDWVSIGALQGAKGEKGDPFEYSDFTPEQLAALKGPKGDPGDSFTYEDFTPQQLEALRGPQGIQGEAFTYDDFTAEQLEALTGPQGPQGNPGNNGYSPTVATSQSGGVTTVTITDVAGTHTLMSISDDSNGNVTISIGGV